MSVGFPIGGGLAWIGGIIFNYLLITLAGEVYPGNQALLWVGVVVIVAAIVICGKAYGKISAGKATTPKKGILLAIVAGLAIMFFYGLVVKSIDPQYVSGGTGTLTPLHGRVLLCHGRAHYDPYLQLVCHEPSGAGQQGDDERLPER